MLKCFSALFFALVFSQNAFCQGLDKIKTGAMKITAIANRHVMVSGAGGLTLGQNILLVRLNPDDDDYETIANGKVVRVKGQSAAVEIDMEKLKKQPLKTDVAVFLGAPKVFTEVNLKAHQEDTIPTLADIEELPPGYIWFQYLMDDGKLVSNSSNQANSFKNMGKIKRTGYNFEWFFDFVPHYGIGFESTSTVVPVRSYSRDAVDATVKHDSFKFMYRTKKYYNLRGIFSFKAATDSFATDNPDEYVISSTVKMNYLGAALDWEPGDLILIDKQAKFEFTFLRMQYSMGLLGTVSDGELIQRGTSSKASANELKIIASGTGYFPWMPWVHRYTLSFEYYQRSNTVSFSGPTRSEANNYAIPQDGNYGENESGLLISLGVRFDDVVGRIFKPKN